MNLIKLSSAFNPDLLRLIILILFKRLSHKTNTMLQTNLLILPLVDGWIKKVSMSVNIFSTNKPVSIFSEFRYNHLAVFYQSKQF